MQSINTLSLAPNARDWLAISRHPRILHVFDRVCNLINERREVLSVVTPEIGDGPFNLVINHDVVFSDHLHVQSPITIRLNQLTLEGLIINRVDANLWSPRPDWKALHFIKDAIFHELTLLPIANYEASLPIPLLTAFSAALVVADIPTLYTTTHRLAGLGPGLTPAGDDFILGAILAAWIIHPPEIASVLAKEVTNITAPLTTSLSAAWLRSAGRGEAGILWHNFLDALLNTDIARVQAATDGILAVGETSGADALSGFIHTFLSFGESEAKSCLS